VLSGLSASVLFGCRNRDVEPFKNRVHAHPVAILNPASEVHRLSVAVSALRYPHRGSPSLNGQQERCLPHNSNPLHCTDSCFAELPKLLTGKQQDRIESLGVPHTEVDLILVIMRSYFIIVIG
jgi:hypothetical protein